MNLRKTLLIQFAIFTLILLLFDLSFSEIRSEVTVSFSGIIKSVSTDHKFIVVNDVSILISSATKIVNDSGFILKAADLKSGLYVIVDGVRGRNGFLAKKILLTKVPAV
jgi:hypothetical protein